MSTLTVGWLSLLAITVLLMLGVPVAFAMLAVGFLGYAFILGWDPAFFAVSALPYAKVASYSFTVIPLFIIMGSFMETAGMVADVFGTAKKWVGGWSGGLVQATILFGAIFAGPCGSGVAGTATVGRLCIPEMLRNRVDKGLAFGTVAVVGPLSAMIPPSTLIVIYCIIADQPVNKLLMAGFIPGFVAAALFMAYIYIRVKLNPSLAPPYKQQVTWKERFISLKSIWGITVIMIVVMGGIYVGVFTPTEAGAIGAFSAFALALAMRRLTWPKLMSIALDATRTVAMVLLILACAGVVGYLIGVTRIPAHVTELITGLQVNRWVFFAAIIIMYLLMGMFFDSITQMILTMPVILPAVLNMGFDPIWYGIIIVHMMELGMITPPFAMSIFVLQGLYPEVAIRDIMRGILPYIGVELIILLVFVFFPWLITLVPSMMK